MLTHSYSWDGLVTISTLEKIASAHLAKSFWDPSFTLECKYVFQTSWITELRDQREAAISKLNIYAEKYYLPSRIKRILKKSIFLLSQAYCEMMVWKRWYSCYMKLYEDLFKEGELYGPNYFSVEGEFDDFSWIKCYVQDSRYPLKSRFECACVYWLENESQTLWEELRNSNSEEYWSLYRKNSSTLIGLRISQLKGKSHLQNREVNKVGFRTALSLGLANAIYYFWQNMSDPERISEFLEAYGIIRIRGHNNFFYSDSPFYEYRYDKLTYFLYSQLSIEHKKDLLDWTVTWNEIGIWLNLTSSYAETVHSDVLDFVFQLPIKMYFELLSLLANRIRLLEIPSDIKILHILWNRISAGDRTKRFLRTEILKEKILIMSHLVEQQEFQNVDNIIKRFSFRQEEELTFNRWCFLRYFKSFLIFSNEGESDLFEKYLIFNLKFRCALQRNINLHLKKIINSPRFRLWFDETSKTESNKIKIDFVFFK